MQFQNYYSSLHKTLEMYAFVRGLYVILSQYNYFIGKNRVGL